MQHDTIWFASPARNWLQCLPIGNGHIGAMLGYDPVREVICLNDDTLWSGYPRDYCKKDFQENLRAARELLLQNKRADAEEIVEKHLANRFTQAYMPMGDLAICLNAGSVERFTRSLELSTGIHTTRYLHDGAMISSESFVSFPEDTLLHRIACETARDFQLSFTSQLNSTARYDLSGITVMGVAPSDLIIGDVGRFSSEKNKVVYDEPHRATHFCVYVQILTDGNVTADQTGLHIAGAKSLLLVLCSATSFAKGDQYAAYAKARVLQAVKKGYLVCREAHVCDHTALYSRSALQLGGDADNPSCENRLKRMRSGEATESDIQLLFQYGRYLLIASSRCGTQAANLQGIWNRDLIPPWWCGYTLNINLQMNYWLADRTNLSACFEPFAAFVERLCEAGRRTAREDYGVEGSVAHHQSDLWAHSTPVGCDRERIPLSARWMMWNTALPWLSLQLYDHYQYDHESRFLSETLYPVMKATAEFMRNTYTITENGRCNVPSTSPENLYLDTDGTARALSVMSAMDIGVSKEFSLAFAQICDTLGQEEEANRWKLFAQGIRDYSVMQNGPLREWDGDYAQMEEGHRHFSMLFGIYPGESLIGGRFQEAARKALDQRLMNGSGQTGWSAVWAALLLARFGEGDAAYDILVRLMRENIHDNLFGAHPPELFQIDANFGFTIAVCELLIQEVKGVVRLLPALPKALPFGSLRGARIHGGHTVSFGWINGAIEWLEIVAAREDVLALNGAGLDRLGLTTAGGETYAISLKSGETQRFIRCDDAKYHS